MAPSDRERAGLRGPVKTCSQEHVSEDPTPTFVFTSEYDRAGRLLSRRSRFGDHESVSTYAYDDAGRLVRIVHQSPGEAPYEVVYQYDQQGRPLRVLPATHDDPDVTFEYDAGGRKTRIERYPPRAMAPDTAVSWEPARDSLAPPPLRGGVVTTHFNQRGEPVEASVHDLDGRLVIRTLRNYDDHGRWLDDIQTIGDGVAAFGADLPAGLSQPQLAALGRWLAAIMDGPAVTFSYDDQGRVRERRRRTMGTEILAAYAYNHHGDPESEVRTILLRAQPSVDIDEEGNLALAKDAKPRQHSSHEVRYRYRYDEHGNWIEQESLRPQGEDREWESVAVLRRHLSYW